MIGAAVLAGWAATIPQTAGGDSAANVQITLRRTSCFGECPVYTVTLAGDGAVVYDGEAAVRVKGRQTSRVSPKAVMALARGD